MANIFNFSTQTIEYQIDGGDIGYISEQQCTGSQYLPPKVMGDWITFEDGSKFRSATSYGRANSFVEPRAAEFTQQRRDYTGRSGYFKTGPGGRGTDRIFSGNMCYNLLSAQGVHNIHEPPGFDTNQRNQAITEALNSIADNKANIAENLATFSQTMKLVKTPLSSLTDIVKKVVRDRSLFPLINKSYRQIYGGGLVDKAAEVYLSYVYGAKPLMQDIHGIFEMGREQGNMPLLLHSKKTVSGATTPQSTAHWSPSYRHGVNVGPLGGDSRTTCHLWAQIDPDYAGTRAVNQLGLLNPASLAWELVPFSFVIDWALPIGPVLQALTAPAGLRFVNGSISRKLNASGPYRISHHWGDGYTDISRSEGSGVFTYRGYSRESLGSWPRPGIWFDPDPLRLASDGSDRIFKALALTILAFPSIRR